MLAKWKISDVKTRLERALDLSRKVLDQAERDFGNSLSRPDRMISTTDIRMVLEKGEVTEDYPEDPRGHSCLILGKGTGGRPVHVLCSPKDDYLAIIKAYLPTEEEWTNDLTVRKKP